MVAERPWAPVQTIFFRVLTAKGYARRVSAGVAAVCLLTSLAFYFHSSSSETSISHPQTLQGWYVQQSEGEPYPGSNSRFTSALASTAQQQQQQQDKLALWPQTAAPLKLLPPFEPTCIATHLERMASWGCPVIMCNKHPSCTITNTSCCAYLNYQMLSFLHDFLEAACLQDEYLVMFGTGLGAVRNQTVIPWTEDVDVGITPLALQWLELNSTREALWRHGYALWHHQAKPFPGYWKVCPHQHHPSPHFQAAMVRKPVQWTKTLRREMAVYTDLWPMWPVAEAVTDCKQRSGSLNTTALLATPWDTQVQPSMKAAAGPAAGSTTHSITNSTTNSISPCRYKQAVSDTAGGSLSLQKWCILYGEEPFYSTPKPRMEKIGERWFPTATDQERILPTVYGPGWRTPDPPNHGTWPHIPDGFTLVDALTQKLSLGVWGGMPYSERKRRCRKLWGRKALGV